jgi:hypothetical protein
MVFIPKFSYIKFLVSFLYLESYFSNKGVTLISLLTSLVNMEFTCQFFKLPYTIKLFKMSFIKIFFCDQYSKKMS